MLKKLILGFGAAVAVMSVSTAALAHDDWKHGWKHGHYKHHYAPGPVYVVPAPRIVYAPPPPAVLYPAPVYSAPVYPAPVYHPAPVYPAPPGVSIRFSFPL